MNNVKIIYDETKSFIGNFNVGEKSAKKSFNPELNYKKEDIMLICGNKIDFNHSFFQGFFEEIICLGVDIDKIYIDDECNAFTRESFDFAKETWNLRK